MINTSNTTEQLVLDANNLSKLKRDAKENSPEAIKGVANQFEAIFMNMVLKSMREATPQDNPFDNEQSRTFTSMLDQQLSTNLANKGLGLADVLARQLSKGNSALQNNLEQTANETTPTSSYEVLANPIIRNPFSATAIASTKNTPIQTPIESNNLPEENALISNKIQVKPIGDSATEFINRMGKHAAEASRSTGVPAHLMLGQAALESGWGKRELKGLDDTPSNNLFGIKATANWSGKVIEATTTEYIHGIKQKRIEKFRAYDSYADSFKDFANLMSNHPRYEKVMANLDNVQAYAQAMQKAGYATDPQYASKLASVIQKVSP
jgi:peptidoglycan hydrolase FlgJ